jgi:hypothetical protein
VADGENGHIVGFEVASIAAALQLETFEGDAIAIDETTAPDAVKLLNRAVKRSAKLFRDEDGDGELSSAERQAGAELAEDEGDD